jgi:hypothetical protein
MTTRKKKAQASGRPEAASLPGGRLPFYVGLLAVAVAAFHAFVQIELIDEGVLNMGAWRIVQGQIPYRDFFTFHTPASFYLVALVYKVFGVALAPGRILAFGLGVGLVATTVALSLRVVRIPLFAAIPVAVLCQAGLGGWPFASHHWIASLLCLVAAWCALRAVEQRPLLWSSLAGASLAGAFWSLNGQGALMLAMILPLYFAAIPRETRGRAAAGWASGGAVVSAPFVALLFKVDAATLRYDLGVFPTTAYKSLEGNRYGFTFPFHELATQWTSGAWRAAPFYNAVVTLTSLFIWLAPILASAVIVFAYLRRWGRPGTRAVIASLGAAFILTAAWRWGPINLQWTAVPPALLVAWALSRWHAEGGARGRRWAAAVAVLLIGSFAFVGAYRIVKTLPGGGLQAVRTPAGTWRTFDARQVAWLQSLVDQIAVKLEPGEPLLCKATPLINFMTQHPNPTRYDLFVPPDYTPDAQVREVIATLDRIHLKWIVTPAFVPSESLFDQYLLSHYELDWDNGELGLWRRTAP